ncbi:MAG: glycoside hydrolase family 6 protein, partial [Pseudomonadota bacterium]
DAALISAMVATPSGIWILGGTPEQARAQVADAVARAARQRSVPLLVAYNHPFRDCTGYGLLGAPDTAAYEAWVDGFASGVANEKAIVILEPNGLGMIPYGVRVDGRRDECRPTRAGADGQRAAPPGATPDERYAQLAAAVDTLVAKAPNAAVYLDGTHSAWLPVGDAAYRLARAGVDRTAGFFLNSGNFQPTGRLIQYGTWVAKCLYLVEQSGADRLSPEPYRQCASQSDGMDPSDDGAWAKVDAWYVDHVDHGSRPPGGPDALTHFVINTNRNGRGPLDVSVYGRPPYNQPPEVVAALRAGVWCMPPGRGLGARPTADTRVPLVDAYLWTDTPGSSVATCDIAEGARAWDYGRYNPWHIAGEAQKHFDPLWGRVLPPAGDWFPDEALTLVRNADPPLGEEGRPAANVPIAQAPAPAPAATSAATSRRPVGQSPVSRGHAGGHGPKEADALQPPSNGRRPTSAAPPLGGEQKAPATQPSFDPANPYR